MTIAQNFKPAALAALLCVGFAAQATVVVNTTGNTTTYGENFDGGSSFSAGGFDAPMSSDDYLWLIGGNKTSSFSFSSAVALTSLTLDFSYAVPSNFQGSVNFASAAPIALGDTPGGVLAFVLTNPSASNAFSGTYGITLFNLAAGNYSVSFSTAPGMLRSLKVDDVLITAVSAVPEPETYALMLAGLAAVAFVARRRRSV